MNATLFSSYSSVCFVNAFFPVTVTIVVFDEDNKQGIGIVVF